jgi:hypothetical protein
MWIVNKVLWQKKQNKVTYLFHKWWFGYMVFSSYSICSIYTHNFSAQLFNSTTIHMFSAQLFNSTTIHMFSAQLFNSTTIHMLSAQLFNSTTIQMFSAQLFNSTVIHMFSAQLFNSTTIHMCWNMLHYPHYYHSQRIQLKFFKFGGKKTPLKSRLELGH